MFEIKQSAEAPNRQHIEFLDSLRGVAILFVFLYHALGVAYGRDQLAWGNWVRDFDAPRTFLPLLPITFGWSGVAIFFVISGFCVHLSFSRQPDWPAFFNRRFFRIYPPYLVVLLFFALIYPLTRLTFSTSLDTAQLVSHLLLIFNTDGRWVFGINGSFWSIAVEAQLYLLYPVLRLIASRLGWSRALLCVGVVEIGLRCTYDFLSTVYHTGLPRWASDCPFFFWFSWSLGAYIAELYLRGRVIRLSRHAFCVLAIAPFVCGFVRPLASLAFPLFALLAAAVISKLLLPPISSLPLADGIANHLRQVGLWSFSLYLIHQPLMLGVPLVLSKVTGGAYVHPLVMFILCALSWFLFVPVARILYLFLELPSIRLGKWFQQRKAVAQPV